MAKDKKYSVIKAILNCGLFYLIYSVPGAAFAQQCEIGAFVGNADHRMPYDYEVQNFENLAGRHLDSVLVYWSWADGDFPLNDINSGITYHHNYNTETVLHLTWEPWSRLGGSDDTFMLENIIAGNYDSYITKFAQDCRDWQRPVRLRFAHEMIQDNNPATGGWYPWQDKPAEYVQAWNYVRQIFQQQGAGNVEFVWSPNNYPADLNTLSQYYPGKDMVDWLGMDGYNFGEDGGAGWPYWQGFIDIFYNMYHVFLDHPEVFGDKQMMISEFASAETNGLDPRTKKDWISLAFLGMKGEFSELDAFYWFNTLKERDWRIDSSAESLLAFQVAMQSSYFTSHVMPEPNMLILWGLGGIYGLINFRVKGFNKRKGGMNK